MSTYSIVLSTDYEEVRVAPEQIISVEPVPDKEQVYVVVISNYDKDGKSIKSRYQLKWVDQDQNTELVLLRILRSTYLEPEPR